MTVLFLDLNATTRGERANALATQTGWKVHPIASVSEGRAWLASAKKLDLLITEAVIDDKSSGFTLRDAALAKFNDARVLFTTRYDLTGYEAKISGGPVLAGGRLAGVVIARLGAPRPPHASSRLVLTRLDLHGFCTKSPRPAF